MIPKVENIFISIPPTLPANNYEDRTRFSRSMVLEPSLAVFYREIIWVGGTKILPDGHRFKVVTKGMQVIFHRSPTPIKHSVCCYVSQSPEGICRKTIMHHQPT